MSFITLVIFSFLSLVAASPSVNYPINAQLPPVARVSKPYDFTFAQGTFDDTGSEVEYSLSKAPSWLKIDSASRTLTGTPDSEDEGESTFNLVAKDDSGSASMEVTLIVTTDDGPTPGEPILPQLAKIGPTSAPSTIFVRPGDSFSISFSPDTFNNTRPSTVYYATSPDNSPLPSWVKFDLSDLKFSGTAPDAQSFSFNLIASDVAGYSAATVSFDIVVSEHILAFDDSAQTLNVSRGEHFSSPQYRNTLKLDGKKPGADDLTSITMDAPDWVSLDKDSISISGTPPDDAVNENVTISVKDTHQDVTKLMVGLEFSRLFTNGTNGCNATIGEDFMFVFNQTVLMDDAIDLEVELEEPLSSWLHYNPNNKTLSGHIPADARPQKFPITLVASKGSTKNKQEFTINTVEGDNDHNAIPSLGGGSNGSKAGIIAISVVVPLVFLSIVFLLFCCWHRKRRAAAHEEEQLAQEKGSRSHPVSSELPQCYPSEKRTVDEDTEALRRHSSSSKPPQLELWPLWSADSDERKDVEGGPENKENTPSNSTIEWDFALFKTPESQEKYEADRTRNHHFSSSSPPLRRRTTNLSKTREPLKPIQQGRSMKRSSPSSKSRRYSKRSSGISSIASGLPVRLSGAGHGAGGFGPSGHGMVRLSWQHPQACLPSNESSLENLAPLFPRPPPVRTRDSVSLGTTDHSKRVTLRPVESRSSTISEDSLEAFVHTRAKCRNSSNPLFSAQSNRRVSSCRRTLGGTRSTLRQSKTPSTTASDEGSRQLTHERPISTAMSGSIYTDENRDSREIRRFSQGSSVVLGIPFSKGQSQRSLGQNYRDMVAPFPRFFSDTSLASGRRGEPEDAFQGLSERNNFIDERQENGGPRRWYRISKTLSPSSTTGMYHQSRRERSSSSSSEPFDSTVQRTSLVRFAGDNNKDEQQWGLGENQQQWRASIEEPSRLPRDWTGSVRGDMAFV